MSEMSVNKKSNFRDGASYLTSFFLLFILLLSSLIKDDEKKNKY